MKTSKPISTISFNSIPFLTRKLNHLVEKRKIVFWCFITHDQEEDEKKAHTHLWIVPNGKINTDQLRDEFDELDLNNKLPLRCLNFKSSAKFQDFYLYNLHDEKYLISKGQSRKLHYRKDDFVASDYTEFSEYIHTIDYSKLNGSRVEIIYEYVENKIPFSELVKKGIVPLQQIKQWEFAYNILYMQMWGEQKSWTVRGEKGKTHE